MIGYPTSYNLIETLHTMLRRLTAHDLPEAFLSDATSYVCGSPVFADAVTDLLIDQGVPANAIRVERFGPSG